MQTQNTTISKASPARSSLSPSMRGNKRGLFGFTLVELIVVISILVILGTIAFLNLGGFSSNARDSSRVSDITNVVQALDVVKAKIGTYPMPSSYTGVTFSGGIAWYQGSIGDSVLNSLNSAGLKFSKKLVDPKYATVEYTYSVLANNKEYQVASAMEDSSISMNPILDSAYAAPATDNLTAYIRGNYNGIMTQVKDPTSGVIYVLALPSIILRDINISNLQSVSTQSVNLVLHKKGNLPGTYATTVQSPANQTYTYTPLSTTGSTAGSGILAAVGLPTDTTGLTALLTNLETIYGSSGLASDSTSAPSVATFLSPSTNASTQNSILTNVLQNSLGGSSQIAIVQDIPSKMPTTTTLDPALSFGTLSNGNLSNAPAGYVPGKGGIANVAMSSGKWYWEVTCGASSQNAWGIGIVDSSITGSYTWYGTGLIMYGGYKSAGVGELISNGVDAAYGASFVSNDIIGVLFNADTKKIEFFKNGVSQGVRDIGISGTSFYPVNMNGSSAQGNNVTYNFGATPFVYPNSYLPTNGSCGAANGPGTYSYPSTNLCAIGSSTSIDGVGSDGTFNWSCGGLNGGTAVSCSAPKIADGTLNRMPTYITLDPMLSSTLADGNLSNSPIQLENKGGIANIPMSEGKWYWEVLCKQPVSQNAYIIGITNSTANFNLPVETGLVFYYGYNGEMYNAGVNGAYGSAYGSGDTVGVLFNADTKKIEFFKNGVSQGVRDISITGSSFYPMNKDGSSAPGNDVTYNFGATPFVYPGSFH